MRQKIFTKITNVEMLNDAINFLKEGFNWSSKCSINIQKSLLNANNPIGFFGFIFKDNNDNIIGAILTHYQGTINENKIINLSSWYVLPKYRGIESIYMARLVKKNLIGFLITNFSPNQAALQIFESIGFKRMNSFTSNFYFMKYSFQLPLFVSKKVKIFKLDTNILEQKNYIGLPEKLLIKDSKIIKIIINNKIFYSLINKSRVEKSLGLIKFSSPRLNILWTSDYLMFENYINNIVPKIMIKFFSPIVSIHFLKFKNNYSNLIWRYHLQYSPNINIEAPVIGSEYSIKL
tara:strand:- start:44 stop:916 length:873 start_codon:yes stop_codon:yes gene_type:complete